MNQELQATATVLSLVNPAICAALFLQSESGSSPQVRLREATKASLAVLLILTAAALAGTRVLHVFGVSLDAFMVAGGGVLGWMGFSMLSAKRATSPSSSTKGESGSSLTPIILFAASPGTITGVITIAAAHTRTEFPVTVLLAIIVATATMWLTMLLFSSLAGSGDRGGFVRDMVTRLMGLIVLSMGVQFALTGYHAFAT